MEYYVGSVSSLAEIIIGIDPSLEFDSTWWASTSGLDLDEYSLNLSYKNLTKKNFDFTPLYFDIANPTPNLGWLLEERKSFHKRFNYWKIAEFS